MTATTDRKHWRVAFYEGCDCITVRGLHAEPKTYRDEDTDVYHVDLDVYKDGVVRCGVPSPIPVTLTKEHICGFREENGELFFKWSNPSTKRAQEAFIGMADADSLMWLHKLNEWCGAV